MLYLTNVTSLTQVGEVTRKETMCEHGRRIFTLFPHIFTQTERQTQMEANTVFLLMLKTQFLKSSTAHVYNTKIYNDHKIITNVMS